jgi:hypothetical protein
MEALTNRNLLEAEMELSKAEIAPTSFISDHNSSSINNTNLFKNKNQDHDFQIVLNTESYLKPKNESSVLNYSSMSSLSKKEKDRYKKKSGANVFRGKKKIKKLFFTLLIVFIILGCISFFKSKSDKNN